LKECPFTAWRKRPLNIGSVFLDLFYLGEGGSNHQSRHLLLVMVEDVGNQPRDYSHYRGQGLNINLKEKSTVLQNLAGTKINLMNKTMLSKLSRDSTSIYSNSSLLSRGQRVNINLGDKGRVTALSRNSNKSDE
jgi:hypothetical protein